MKFFKNAIDRLLYRHSSWERSDDIVGHRPTFKIKCRMCRPWWRPKVEMLLRNSKLMISVREEAKVKEVAKVHVHRLNYKCPRCDWVTAFIKPDDTDYILEIQKRRGGQTLYYPGFEVWVQNKFAREKLESLGYF